jgi:hypothetical protein
VIEIREQHAEAVVSRIVDAGRARDIGKAAPSVAVVQDVCFARQSLRPARHIDGHEATSGGLAAPGDGLLVELQVVGDVEIEVAVAVVVAEGASRAPPRIADAGLPCRVRERAVAIVSIQRVGAHRARHVHILEAVVVVVGGAHAHPPASPHQAAAGGHVREAAAPVVVVQGRQGIAALPGARARGTVDQEEIELAVVVVVEPGGAAADLVDDVVLGGATADVEQRDARLCGDVNQLDGDVCGAGKDDEKRQGERDRRARPEVHQKSNCALSLKRRPSMMRCGVRQTAKAAFSWRTVLTLNML